MAIDPVCGMELNEKNVKSKMSYNGATYYFCSDECREDFERSPENFIDDEGLEEIGA